MMLCHYVDGIITIEIRIVANLGKIWGLEIKRSRIQLPVMALQHNNIG